MAEQILFWNVRGLNGRARRNVVRTLVRGLKGVEASLHILVGDGKATLFWSDRWLDGDTIKELAPDLFQSISY